MSQLLSAAAVVAIAGSASAATISPVDQADFAALEASLGTSLVPINMATEPIVSLGGGLNGQNNVLTSTFDSTPFYSGTLISEVFANQSAIGPGVNTVVIKYTFISDGTSFENIDSFNFGTNSGVAIDLTDVEAATHGSLLADNVSRAQNPLVTTDSFGGNNTLDFNFLATEQLGPGDTHTWYVAATGDVRVNVVDVTISDFVATTAEALIFTTTDGQDDLNVPTPGVAALGAIGLAAASRRRRR